MPVVEQLMGLGEWSLRFHRDTPNRVKEAAWHPHSTIVVTPGPSNPDQLGDDGMLAVARYTGVVLGRTVDELSGAGMAWWLGDRDDQGSSSGWNTWVGETYAYIYNELVYTHLEPGTYPAGGSITKSYRYSRATARQILDEETRSYGHEWRVNPDLTVDANTVTVLYGTGGLVILMPGGGRTGGPSAGDDTLTSIDAEFDLSVDWEQLYHSITVAGRDRTQTSTPAASSSYRSPNGDATHLRNAYISVPQITGNTLSYANQIAPKYQSESGRVQVAVARVDERVEQLLGAGHYVWAYDLAAGLYDDDYYTVFDGRRIFPALMRVAQLTWPLRRGMGVYSRVWFVGDGAPTYTDLTPYIEWEDGSGGSIEVITDGDVRRFTGESAAGRVDPVFMAETRAAFSEWESYTPTWTTSGTQPTLSNGTLVGAYRVTGTTGTFRAVLTVGGSTTVGTGDIRFALPDGWEPTSWQAGPAWFFDSSGGVVIRGTAILQEGVAYVSFVVNDASSRALSEGLASGDILTCGPCTIEIEAS